MELRASINYQFDLDQFFSKENTCENCSNFEYDINLEGDQFYFCNVQELNQKECKLCIFYNRSNLL